MRNILRIFFAYQGAVIFTQSKQKFKKSGRIGYKNDSRSQNLEWHRRGVRLGLSLTCSLPLQAGHLERTNGTNLYFKELKIRIRNKK
jgi:hypothetical protein